MDLGTPFVQNLRSILTLIPYAVGKKLYLQPRFRDVYNKLWRSGSISK